MNNPYTRIFWFRKTFYVADHGEACKCKWQPEDLAKCLQLLTEDGVVCQGKQAGKVASDLIKDFKAPAGAWSAGMLQWAQNTIIKPLG